MEGYLQVQALKRFRHVLAPNTYTGGTAKATCNEPATHVHQHAQSG